MKAFAVIPFLILSAAAFAATPAKPVAYVYVQPRTGPDGTAPIHVYAAASDGKLTLTDDTATAGTIVGTNGKHFITLTYIPTLDTEINSYDVASDGAIGKLATRLTGLECGDVAPQAELDHSGKYVWVSCAGDLKTFSTSKLVLESEITQASPNLPTFSGTAEIPIGVYNQFSCTSVFYTGNGAPLTVVNPNPVFPGFTSYIPAGPITNDPTDHLAVAMAPISCRPDGTFIGDPQLASFTVTQSGDDVKLTSTNTYENMPTVPVGGGWGMILNPAGTVLAVDAGTGIQFYHFNGAKPITNFTEIAGTTISAMAWDKDNHLYAIGRYGILHVYEATTTKVEEVSGSPYDNVCGSDTCTLIVRSNRKLPQTPPE
jgi:hypothetical protein